MDCIVCQSTGIRHFAEIDSKTYWRCPACLATFLDPAQMPDAASERAHYEHHENDVGDPGYRAFLNRLAVPLLQKLTPAATGLDYGCGPGPALAAMLREEGHEMAVYDPFFSPGMEPLSQTYDFITCTEVVEHFHKPAEEFQRLTGLINPGGWLGIMTCFQTDDEKFAKWHYRADPTHVVFYRDTTFCYVAKQWGWSCTIPAKDIVLLQKPWRENA